MLGRLYGMDDLCEYITWKGPFLRTLLICYVTWYELTNQNAVFAFLCSYMVWRVLKKDPRPRNPIITLLIANQIRDLCYSYCYQFNWTGAQAMGILPFGQALQSSLLLPGALL